ncbi:MAG: hypothetical protein RHS_4027 [Robinsoniella sp. RHS]|nr:MAG: hypothetical protein RHS_4027 [Robinsoniella sp. RHS]
MFNRSRILLIILSTNNYIFINRNIMLFLRFTVVLGFIGVFLQLFFIFINNNF